MPEIGTNAEWRAIMVRARKPLMTQSDLGERVGLSQVMISKIESGEAESSTYILRICRTLNIPAPQHFADEWQQRWSQLGHVLRNRSPEQSEAAMNLIETLLKGAEQPAPSPSNDSDPSPPRK